MRAALLPPPFKKMTAEFTVIEGSRSQELDIVRKAWERQLADDRWLIIAAEDLRACCPTSRVLEPVWGAACQSRLPFEEVERCAEEFHLRYPKSFWASRVDRYVRSERESKAERDHKAYVKKARGGKPDWNRYVAIINMPLARVTADLATDFVRDFSDSSLAPEVLAYVISRLEDNGRSDQAHALARELVVQYPK